MSIGVYNLLIPKGTTFETAFKFRHKIVLVKDLMPGATSITIAPLTTPLTNDKPLSFPMGGCMTADVMLSEAVSTLGVETLPIQTYSGKRVPCGTSAKGPVMDLTGRIYRAAIRQAEADATAMATFNCIVDDPLSGIVVPTLTHTTTAALLSNADYRELPWATGSDPQLAESFSQRLIKKAYFWDMEYELSGKVKRVFYGMVFVPWEATR